MPEGRGEVRVGAVLDLQLRLSSGRRGPHRPVVVGLIPSEEIVLAATFGHRWLVHMVHEFQFEATETAPGTRRSSPGCRMLQRWNVSGLLVPLLWPTIVAALSRFTELGDDLAGQLRTNPTGS